MNFKTPKKSNNYQTSMQGSNHYSNNPYDVNRSMPNPITIGTVGNFS